mgnify:CR=1 FL=1
MPSVVPAIGGPLVITAMALAVASMALLARTGRTRHAVGAAMATALGLLFVEKALIVPAVAAVVLFGDPFLCLVYGNAFGASPLELLA